MMNKWMSLLLITSALGAEITDGVDSDNPTLELKESDVTAADKSFSAADFVDFLKHIDGELSVKQGMPAALDDLTMMLHNDPLWKGNDKVERIIAGLVRKTEMANRKFGNEFAQPTAAVIQTALDTFPPGPRKMALAQLMQDAGTRQQQLIDAQQKADQKAADAAAAAQQAQAADQKKKDDAAAAQKAKEAAAAASQKAKDDADAKKAEQKKREEAAAQAKKADKAAAAADKAAQKATADQQKALDAAQKKVAKELAGATRRQAISATRRPEGATDASPSSGADAGMPPAAVGVGGGA